MPGLDGTGPEGKGPRTGQRHGNCGKKPEDKIENKHKCCGHKYQGKCHDHEIADE